MGVQCVHSACLIEPHAVVIIHACTLLLVTETIYYACILNQASLYTALGIMTCVSFLITLTNSEIVTYIKLWIYSHSDMGDNSITQTYLPNSGKAEGLDHTEE